MENTDARDALKAGLKVRRLVWDLEIGELTLFFYMRSDHDLALRIQLRQAGNLTNVGCSKFGHRWQITEFVGAKPADINGEQIVAAVYKIQRRQSDMMLSVVLGQRCIPFEEDEVDILVFGNGDVPQQQSTVIDLTAG